ncbi:uncharacterized protein LOC116163187 [Photinus pyralis]|uniref:uncharacterized protein LOC116163187 n=1 Tax=Photinus pyralis TaxID=7054 RepID=UPI0012673AAE|nr:uncharacterized protein LOC116163187 [Photinus pyralis]
MEYRSSKGTYSFSENVVLGYFLDLSKKMKPSTLWANYSMLKATLMLKQNVDITSYNKLRAYLKKQSVGYKAKKSKVFTNEQIREFMMNAPDDTYLMAKVVVIFGIYGACRREELCNIKLTDIEDLGSQLLVKIPCNKTNKPRSFIVNDTYLETYRKYAAVRPSNFHCNRFFFKYHNGKGFKQVVGVHTFASIPQIVANFLKLSDANLYTGHCFRRTSATILVDNGADLTVLKRHGGWKSSNVAEGYIEESLKNKMDVAERIVTSISGAHIQCKGASNVGVSTSTISKTNTESTSSINYEVESTLTGLPNLIGTCNNCTINVHINRQ